MKMPGFTAEASLYEAKGHYRTAGAGGSTALVLPQCGSSSRCWNCQVERASGRCKCTFTNAAGCTTTLRMNAATVNIDNIDGP